MTLSPPATPTSFGKRHPITPRQQEVLDFIGSELDAGRPFPGTTIIAQHIGWSSPSCARDSLEALALKGALSRIPAGRGWRYELPKKEKSA